MAWNSDPHVRECADIAVRWEAKQIIILAIDEEHVKTVTYGRTKRLCDEALELGRVASDAVIAEMEDLL